MNDTNPQHGFARLLGPLVVGLYAWLAAVSFGFAWLDIIYARLVPQATTAFSEVADFFLFVGAITVLAGVYAMGLSWNAKAARNFLIASLAVGVLGFLVPAFLSPLLQDGSAWGAGIRIAISCSVSVLAFIGFYKFRLN